MNGSSEFLLGYKIQFITNSAPAGAPHCIPHTETMWHYNNIMVAIESLIYLSDRAFIINNSESLSSGGNQVYTYLAQSELFSLQESTSTISSNSVTEKGGLIATVSSFS